MKIRSYTKNDRVIVTELLYKLQNYIASLDSIGSERSGKDFDVEEYVRLTLEKVDEREGVVFLVEDNKTVVGLVIGAMDALTGIDAVECFPRRFGKVLELYIEDNYRSKGVGKLLMEKIEEYFKSKDCSAIVLECFGPNFNAYEFYKKNGYTNRVYNMIKII